MRRLPHCWLLDVLMGRNKGSKKESLGTTLLPMSRGKQKAGVATQHVLTFRRSTDLSGPVPVFIPLGTVTVAAGSDVGLRVISVAKGSPADAAGIKPFDRILELHVPMDNRSTSTRGPTKQIPLEDHTLEDAIRFSRLGRLRIERPHRDAHGELVMTIRTAAAGASDDLWILAVAGCISCDEAQTISCVRQMVLRGDEALSRTCTELEARLVHLTLLASGDAGAVEGQRIQGAHLVELALDLGHREMAHHLLELVDLKESSRATTSCVGASGATCAGGSSASGSSLALPEAQGQGNPAAAAPAPAPAPARPGKANAYRSSPQTVVYTI